MNYISWFNGHQIEMGGVTQIVMHSYYCIILTKHEKLLIFILCLKRVAKDYDIMFVHLSHV